MEKSRIRDINILDPQHWLTKQHWSSRNIFFTIKTWRICLFSIPNMNGWFASGSPLPPSCSEKNSSEMFKLLKQSSQELSTAPLSSTASRRLSPVSGQKRWTSIWWSPARVRQYKKFACRLLSTISPGNVATTLASCSKGAIFYISPENKLKIGDKIVFSLQCYGSALTSMRILIQLISMRIRTQGANPMRIWIRILVRL